MTGVRGATGSQVASYQRLLRLLIASATLTLLSCANRATAYPPGAHVYPFSAHMPATPSEPEHDEIETKQVVLKSYPELNGKPGDTVVRVKTGGMLWLTCTQRGDPCTQVRLKAIGLSNRIPNGIYLCTPSDDANLVVAKSEEGILLGYLAAGRNGSEGGFYTTLIEARAHEGAEPLGYSLMTVIIISIVGYDAIF